MGKATNTGICSCCGQPLNLETLQAALNAAYWKGYDKGRVDERSTVTRQAKSKIERVEDNAEERSAGAQVELEAARRNRDEYRQERDDLMALMNGFLAMIAAESRHTKEVKRETQELADSVKNSHAQIPFSVGLLLESSDMQEERLDETISRIDNSGMLAGHSPNMTILLNAKHEIEANSIIESQAFLMSLAIRHIGDTRLLCKQAIMECKQFGQPRLGTVEKLLDWASDNLQKGLGATPLIETITYGCQLGGRKLEDYALEKAISLSKLKRHLAWFRLIEEHAKNVPLELEPPKQD
jgi:hypothetical protein